MLQTRTSWTFWRSCRRSRTLWVCLHTHTHKALWLSHLLGQTCHDWWRSSGECSLCLCLFIFLFSYVARKRNRLLLLNPFRISPWYQSAHAGQCQCVGASVCLCISVCVWVCTRYAVPQPNPSNPWSSCCLHAGVTVPVFPSLQLCYFYPPTWVDVAVCLSVSYWILMLSF